MTRARPRLPPPHRTLHWVLAAALHLGCSGDPPADAPGAPSSPRTDAAAAPSLPSGPTVEERRARFEARPALEPSSSLPPAWRSFLKEVDARPSRIVHEVRTGPAPGHRWIELELRLFDADDAVERRLHAALKRLDLPGLGEIVPREEMRSGATRWAVEVRRLVAPPGEPREHRVTLRWSRTPPPPPEPPRCRRPASVDAVAEAPGWFQALGERRSTRQRISARVELAEAGIVVREHLYFWNGFAHDEHVGRLAQAAGQAGLKHVEGSGPRQRWSDDAGRTLSWRPDNGDLGLGCTPAGPVIEITWAAPSQPQLR